MKKSTNYLFSSMLNFVLLVSVFGCNGSSDGLPGDSVNNQSSENSHNNSSAVNSDNNNQLNNSTNNSNSDNSSTTQNLPPVAELTTNVSSGEVPLLVLLDGSSSYDPDSSSEPLMFRWDFDGDGLWDTSYSTVAKTTFTFTYEGEFFSRLEVKDSSGLTDDTSLTQPIIVVDELVYAEPLLADINVDSNKNGIVDSNDDIDEDGLNGPIGAVFMANLDDDDGDFVRDFQDSIINGESDKEDLAPIVIKRVDGINDAHVATLSIQPIEALSWIRIWAEPQPGETTIIHDREGSEHIIPNSMLASGDLNLWLEGIVGRYDDFDGFVLITFAISDSDGNVISEDSVNLHGGPIIFPDNTKTGNRVFVMDIPSSVGETNNEALISSLNSHLPDDMELYTIDSYIYDYDRWAQDSMQTDYI
mgnify:CR=1 FL=1